MKKHKVLIRRVDGFRQHYHKNYGMAVIPRTTVPVIDYPEDYNTVKKKLIVNMPPQKYFDTLQKEIVNKLEIEKSKDAGRYKEMTPEQFRKGLGGMSEESIKENMKKLKRGEDVPTGYILKSKYIDTEGKSHPSVEFDVPWGIEAARRLGIKEVPVVLAEGRTSRAVKGKFWPEWEYSPEEIARRDDEESRTVIEGIQHQDFDKGTINIIHSKRLKKGATPGSKYESDYEDEPSDTWRDVVTVDVTKVK